MRPYNLEFQIRIWVKMKSDYDQIYINRTTLICVIKIMPQKPSNTQRLFLDSFDFPAQMLEKYRLQTVLLKSFFSRSMEMLKLTAFY